MGSSVLVVEDEPDLVATYERLLGRLGYQVSAAVTKREALDTIGVQPFDLVVTDLRLPDGDGLDIVRAARAVQKPAPVVVVTGFPSATSRQQALDAGASAYLAKPFSIGQFVAIVDRLAAAVR